ncbi:hypothetical protein SLE2022_135030 [Rubroshorea leprosula]
MDVPLEIRLIQKELDRLNSLEEAANDPSYLTPISVAFGPVHHPSDDDADSRLHRAEKSKLLLAAKFINTVA